MTRTPSMASFVTRPSRASASWTASDFSTEQHARRRWLRGWRACREEVEPIDGSDLLREVAVAQKPLIAGREHASRVARGRHIRASSSRPFVLSEATQRDTSSARKRSKLHTS